MFFLNLEDGYFGCQVNESTEVLQLLELSKLCDDHVDCYQGTDEQRDRLKCTGKFSFLSHEWKFPYGRRENRTRARKHFPFRGGGKRMETLTSSRVPRLPLDADHADPRVKPQARSPRRLVTAITRRTGQPVVAFLHHALPPPINRH